MNVLVIYNATQTYTNTVFEHLKSFVRYSKHQFFFCHQAKGHLFNVALSRFDAVIIHYSVRLPFDQIAESTETALIRFRGLKVLFIQDEYDYTYRSWHWIKHMGIQLVFTCVPSDNIERVYPPAEFPGVRFVNNLTGYVPEDLPPCTEMLPPSKRKIVVGYRGRSLPVRYGQLGLEKVGIGIMVKKYCEANRIKHDIAWDEKSRIYGVQWYKFIMSCRSTLGSESGSNVFDWEGTLASRIEAFRQKNGGCSEDDVYKAVVAQYEQPGLMNQISPRVFEAIGLRTALVLYEGAYSDIVIPGRHYIPLKKDGSNLEEVFTLLEDETYVNEMVDRAYEEIVAPTAYSYRSFIRKVDGEMDLSITLLNSENRSLSSPKSTNNGYIEPSSLTTDPIRIEPSSLTTDPIRGLQPLFMEKQIWMRIAYRVWMLLPKNQRNFIRPILKMVLRRNS